MTTPLEYDDRFNPFLTAIGRVAVGWAEYESTINLFIWELANIEKKAGTCLTAQLIGPDPRFRCLLALLGLRNAPQPLIGDFNSHHQKAKGIAMQRNRYLHDPLLINNKTGQIDRMETTADKHVRHELVATEVADLDKLHAKIGVLINDLDALYERTLVELPPWPRTQFEQSQGIYLRRKETGSSG